MVEFDFKKVFEDKRDMMPRSFQQILRAKALGMKTADEIMAPKDTPDPVMDEAVDPNTFENIGKVLKR